MSYHPRIESKEIASFLTTRCRNSELWFANNKPVEDATLGYVAKFKARYRVKLYALALEGTHIQAPAHFPDGNRAQFMRDFISCVARAVARLTPNYTGGRLTERRYSSEFLPGNPDIEHYFFYTVLQPVEDCLVEKISDYPFYNCFSDAVNGIERRFKVINWADYYSKKRFNPDLKVKDFTHWVSLKYDRLPGYEHLTQKDYSKLMHKKLEEKRSEIVKRKISEGRKFLGREALLRTIPGTPAKNPKKSTINSHRPRILSVCDQRRAECKDWYFRMYFEFKRISKLYRDGLLNIIFPEGMYPPHRLCQLSLSP